MAVIELAKGIRAHVRPAIGADERSIYAIRAKIEPLLADRGTEDAEYNDQYQFALAMVVTEKVEGMNFPLLKASDDAQALADAYRAWLRLPLRIYNAWRRAPLEVEDLSNFTALLPPELLPEASRNDPLSEGGESSKGKK